MKNKKTAAGLSVLIASALLLAPSLKKDKDPCRIDLGIPHISTFLAERKGIAAVKVNAFSTCNRPHSRVTLVVELWKEEEVFKKKLVVTVARHPGVIPPNERFENKETFVPCKSDKVTLYFARAHGKAMIDGVWQFASSKSLRSYPVKCGT